MYPLYKYEIWFNPEDGDTSNAPKLIVYSKSEAFKESRKILEDAKYVDYELFRIEKVNRITGRNITSFYYTDTYDCFREYTGVNLIKKIIQKEQRRSRNRRWRINAESFIKMAYNQTGHLCFWSSIPVLFILLCIYGTIMYVTSPEFVVKTENGDIDKDVINTLDQMQPFAFGITIILFYYAIKSYLAS
jgi:hypothetical protein